MNSVIENLYDLLSKEFAELDKIVEKNQDPCLFIELIRCIDYSFLFSYKEKEVYEHFIQLGYGRCLEELYKVNTFRRIIYQSIHRLRKFRIGVLICFCITGSVR